MQTGNLKKLDSNDPRIWDLNYMDIVTIRPNRPSGPILPICWKDNLIQSFYKCTFVNCFVVAFFALYCICIMTREVIYGKIYPKHKLKPVGGARGLSWGLWLYLILYGNLGHNTIIIIFQKLYFQYYSSREGNIGRVD